MFNQRNSGEKTIQSKLLTIFVIVALTPMLLVTAAIFAGELQPVLLIGAVFCQLVGLVLAWQFGKGLITQTSSLCNTLQRINQGDRQARSESTTNDQLGAAARELNALCDNQLNNTAQNCQTASPSGSHDEWPRLQRSFDGLIAEMRQIAAGNLDISVDVKDDTTGSIAKSVNQMTQQLRAIVYQVKSAADQVSQYSSNMRKISESKSQESDSHARLIHEATEKIVTMTDSFQKVADMTRESVQVAVETRQSATKGQKAVSATVDGMHRIRNQVQSTSKRIKRLGESSQEIGEIVQLISDISDRTSILALNASIQASMAGDAGHGFAVIAEEIERLAERSSDATLQISKLIRAVQNETGEVISDMEESTREVVAGSHLAAEAGETLFEIDSVSNQLVELIQSSSNYALQQADLANQIADSMSEISDSTQRSADHSRESNRAIGLLDNMVRKLNDSVSRFKISSGDPPVAQPSFKKTPGNDHSITGTPARPSTENSLAAAQQSSGQRPRTSAATVQKQPATATDAKMSPRQPQPTMMLDAPPADAVRQPMKTATTGPTTGQAATTSNEGLLRRLREKMSADEARKAEAAEKKGTSNSQQKMESPKNKTQASISNTLVMDDDSSSAPAVTDEKLLKKAQEMLKELKSERGDKKNDSVASDPDQPAVSRTLNIDNI